MAEALVKGCSEGCTSMLDLRNTEGEKRYGFVSFFLHKLFGLWYVKQYKKKEVSSFEKKGAPV